MSIQIITEQEEKQLKPHPTIKGCWYVDVATLSENEKGFMNR